MNCECRYTPDPKPRGYPEEMHKQAWRMYVDGMNLRCITRHLGVHHRTVSLSLQACAARISEASLSEEVTEVEMDGLFTYIGHKKNESTSLPL